MTDRVDRLQKIASAMSIGGIRRHIFLCAEQTTPRCTSYEESSAAWKQLKAATKSLDLATAPPGWRGDFAVDPPDVEQGSGTVLRSKVDCLRVCEQGPIAVVYPDGVWYHSAEGEVLDRIIREHLVEGQVVGEYVFALDRLG